MRLLAVLTLRITVAPVVVMMVMAVVLLVMVFLMSMVVMHLDLFPLVTFITLVIPQTYFCIKLRVEIPLPITTLGHDLMLGFFQ